MARLGDTREPIPARQLRPGDIVAGLRRYQPFVATVVAGLLLVLLLPDPSPTDEARTFAGGGPGAGVEGPDGSSSAGAGGSPGGAGVDGAGPDAVDGRAGGGGGTGGGGGPVAVSGTFGWRAMGTDAALSAPDCDRATGHLKIRTKVLGIPCVPMWPPGGDNGGATTRGVTADTVTLVVFQAPPSATNAAIAAFGASDSPENFARSVQGYVDLYNRHSETYGRKVEVVFVQRSGTDPETARADVIDVIEQHQPFALFQAEQTTGESPAIPAAQRQVLATGNEPGTSFSDPTFLDELEPYLWNATYGVTNPYAAAEVLCELQGKPAKWAADPVLRTQTRKFGWIFEDVPARRWYNEQLRRQFEACGLEFAEARANTADQAEAAQQMVAIMARFRADGVTTVGVSGQVQLMVAPQPAAAQGYRPEFFSNNLNTFTVRLLWPREQADSLFGIAADGVPAPRPPVPDQHQNVLYRWEHGIPSPSNSSGQFHAQMVSWLFQGIALAGPNLTPETFRDGLFHMPPAGGSFDGSVTENSRAYGPQGYWPFPNGLDNYSANGGDYRLGFFDGSKTCADEGNIEAQGCISWIAGGQRVPIGQLPSGEPPYFSDPSAVASLDELPANEVPPDYENRRDCANRWECWAP